MEVNHDGTIRILFDAHDQAHTPHEDEGEWV